MRLHIEALYGGSRKMVDSESETINPTLFYWHSQVSYTESIKDNRKDNIDTEVQHSVDT